LVVGSKMCDFDQQNKKLDACRVLVTSTTFGKHDPGLRSALENAVGEVVYNTTGRPLKVVELADLIRDMDGCIAGLDPFDASVMEAGKRLMVIARYGVGLDAVDLGAATRLGIVVTNTPGANAVAVAELTIGLILALARQICAVDRATRQGEWPRTTGVGLRGKTIGLIGFGSVGREVALRLKCFGCTVLTTDPGVKPETAQEYCATLSSLDALLGAADFVSLHAALHHGTAGMVDRAFLLKMKPGSFLVNTARGELIDETALQQVLEEGHLRGAAVDCYRQEPPGVDCPLLKLPQVILTPHMGAHSDEAATAMGWMALEDCLAVLRGERPKHVVNPEVYAR
jgi:D-3-phosphoglycerate dehydrogenase